MYSIEFNYNEYIREVHCDYFETIRSVCKRYAKKSNLDVNALGFIYLGKELNYELNFAQTAADIDKNRKIMTVFVVDKYLDEFNVSKAREIICPECFDSALLEIKKFNINIYDCQNGHQAGNFLLDEIEESQLIDLTQIKCEICKIYSRGYTYRNQFYRCNTCKKNLCPICELRHDKTHRIINYDRKNYVCQEHNKSYHSYCKNCKINMCVLCEKNHEKHHIIYLHKMIKKDKDDLIKFARKLREAVNTFSRDVKMIINRLNLVKENMKSFFELYYNIIYNYEEERINYEILKNLDQVRNNHEILELLESINNENDIYKKFKYMYEMYSEMIYKNEVTMVYSISNHQEELKIFGEEFVKNNVDKCKIRIDGKEEELKSIIVCKPFQEKLKDKIKVKLLNINNVIDMSFIFHECKNLIACNDLSKWNTKRIRDMHKLFFGCSQLSKLPDLSFWSISQVKDICGLFYECSSLLAVPDISEWDVSKIINLSGLFCGCEKIKSLPDISRWDTSNVTDMNGLFCGCSVVESIPNIEKWNTDKVKNLSGLFCGCAKITKVPDLSRWNTSKVKDFSGMFFSCSKLLSLPDISKWSTHNVKNMTGMFGDCVMLSSLPDLSKWSLNKKVLVVNMFKGCNENLEIPDKFKKVKNNKPAQE